MTLLLIEGRYLPPPTNHVLDKREILCSGLDLLDKPEILCDGLDQMHGTVVSVMEFLEWNLAYLKLLENIPHKSGMQIIQRWGNNCAILSPSSTDTLMATR